MLWALSGLLVSASSLHTFRCALASDSALRVFEASVSSAWARFVFMESMATRVLRRLLGVVFGGVIGYGLYGELRTC